MERSICFEEVVTYDHEIIIKAYSEELLDNIVENVQCKIVSGDIEDKEDIISIIKEISKGDIDKITFVEDDSPNVEINCI